LTPGLLSLAHQAENRFVTMRVALFIPLDASKKEPLAAMMDRVHDSFG
jgi:hypothetical protein